MTFLFFPKDNVGKKNGKIECPLCNKQIPCDGEPGCKGVIATCKQCEISWYES